MTRSHATKVQQYQLQEAMRLPSVASFQKLGVSRHIIWRLLTEEFVFPQEFRDTLEEYRILYWSPEYVFRELYKNPQFKLRPQDSDTDYIVIFHRGSISQLKEARSIACSFRKPKPELQLPAYVLLAPSHKDSSTSSNASKGN